MCAHLVRSVNRAIRLCEFHTLHRSLPNLSTGQIAASSSSLITGSPQKLKKSTSEKDTIGTSTILVQDGLEFQELPVIVQKTSKISSSGRLLEKSKVEKSSLSEGVDDLKTVLLKEDFSQCRTLEQICQILEELMPSQISPEIAAAILKRIADLQGNLEFRNKGSVLQSNTDCAEWTTLITKLCDIVCTSKDISVILEGLQSAVRGNLLPTNNNILVDKISQELLLRITNHEVDIDQIHKFASLIAFATGEHTKTLDQLWTGIIDRQKEINEENLIDMYKLLPFLKKSRGMIFRVLEKRTYLLWWKLNVEKVAEILEILYRLSLYPSKLLTALSKWINLHIHTIDEYSFIRLVISFKKLDHVDDNIAKAIERYVKARGNKIKDATLVSTVMDFCLHFRLRSVIALDTTAAYFIENCHNLSALHIVRMVLPFGILNYVPPNSFDFYGKLEEVIDSKFVQFRPEDLIELLLSCTYVKRYPLNFMRKVFNPHFLDRLNTIQNEVELLKARNNLKLLDAAMTLECPQYRGPLLPRNISPCDINRDGRVIKLLKTLHGTMVDLLGGADKFSSSELLAKLPVTELYIVDFIIHFNKFGEPIPFSIKCGIVERKAIIIHLKEHYCLNSQLLLGEQVMKIRHLQLLGYDVIQLDLEDLNRIHHQPQDRIKYLQAKIFHQLVPVEIK